MAEEMVSTSVDNAPAFLQLRDKYKQDLVEDTRLTKAADLWGVNYAIGPKKYVNRWCPSPWCGWHGCRCDPERRG